MSRLDVARRERGRSARPVFVLVALGALASCSFLKQVQDRTGAKVNDPTGVTGACKHLLEVEIPWEEERDVGGTLAVGLANQGGNFLVEPALDGGTARPSESSTDQLNLAVAQVGFTVTGYSSRPDLPWVFGVLDTETPNAFSTPGGYVFVTRGLLRQVENESQLAGVLAHEAAHVALRHALHVYRTTKAVQCGAERTRAQTIGTVNVGVGSGTRKSTTLISGDALSKQAFETLIDPTIDLIVSKGYARGDELEADAMATDLLVMAGYNPREYQKLLAKLPAGKGIYPNHPLPADRAARVAERLKTSWGDFAVDQNPAVPSDPRIAAALGPAK